MATFNQAKDRSGNDVVRCFVKGAAPAVMSRAATALANGSSVPWDDAMEHRAQEHVKRMGEAGLRVMAGAYRDLDPAGFDPEGDLLALVDGLEMTSLVGMVDPPREESKAAVRDAQSAHIRVRMVTGDDVVTGASIAKQLGIPGRGDPGRRVRGPVRGGAARAHRPHRCRRPGRARAQGSAGRHAQEKGARRGHDWRWGQRRPRHQSSRHRRRHGERDRSRQKRQPHDPLRRQLRHHRLRGGTGPQALRQPQQVHPLRAPRAGRVRTHLPRRHLDRPRGRPAVHPGADPLDQLSRQRPLRGRPRLRRGDPRLDATAGPVPGGVNPHHGA